MSVKHNKITVTTKDVAKDKIQLRIYHNFKSAFHRFIACFCFLKLSRLKKKYFNEQEYITEFEAPK
jgi:hypothetical protein